MNWYVAYTHPRKEAVAQQNLLNQGFDAYMPRYQKRCRHARRVYLTMAPLFPRYLFIRMNPAEQRWRAINGTIGVSYLLCDGPAPISIPDEVVDAINAREDNGIVRIAPPEFSKGQRLCVTDGAFADLEGLFECVDDDSRVVMLLEFMGRVVRTRLPGHAVTAA